MTRKLLLDTGALVSMLDRSQARHREFVDFYEGWQGQVVSTEAVLTETTHLLSKVPSGPAAAIDFFLQGGAVLVPANIDSLTRCRNLMVKYHDLPMDFADASLVVLGEELESNLILTTDHRDFAVYRLARDEGFEIVP